MTAAALLAAACNVRPNDYDGDKKADIVYLSGSYLAGMGTSGTWRQLGVDTPLWTGTYDGLAVGGDYDNDGKWEPAELQGREWVSSKLATPIHFDPAGMPTAAPDWPTAIPRLPKAILPVPADYDGDGDTDAAYYAVVDGTWWINGRVGSTQFGLPPRHDGHTDWDLPVPGDYDGDKKADLAVFRPTDSTFHILLSTTGTERVVQVGPVGGNIPVPADWNGDGTLDPAVADPDGHRWWIAPGSAAPSFSLELTGAGNGSYPVVADYDGDGLADAAVYDWGPMHKVWARLGGIETTLATLPTTAGDMPAFPFAELDNFARLTVYDRCLDGQSSNPIGNPSTPPPWTVCPPAPLP